MKKVGGLYCVHTESLRTTRTRCLLISLVFIDFSAHMACLLTCDVRFTIAPLDISSTGH